MRSLSPLVRAFALIRAKRRWLLGVVASIAAVLVAVEVVRFVHGFSAMGVGGISQAEFDSAKLGQGEASVQARLGQPLTQQDVEYSADPPPGDECIYYFDSAGVLQGGSTFRLCFRSGVLVLKDGFGSDFDTPDPTVSFID